MNVPLGFTVMKFVTGQSPPGSSIPLLPVGVRVYCGHVKDQLPVSYWPPVARAAPLDEQPSKSKQGKGVIFQGA